MLGVLMAQIAGLKVVLDVCDVQLFGAREDLESQEAWNATQV